MLSQPGKIGLALGSGAARGWAHVGVIRALEQRGLQPHVVAGTSAGGVVGALYAAGRLDAFEAWGRQLDWRQVVGYFDLSLRGGLIKARKLIEFLTAELGDLDLRDLQLPFAVVATDLETGREIWLREGPVVECLRAGMALPGLVTPVRIDGRWLVDGGLVNAVPVSVCRAMGADTVIAVDLNTTLLGRRVTNSRPAVPASAAPSAPRAAGEGRETEGPGPSTVDGIADAILDALATLREKVAPNLPGEAPATAPSIYEVVANSINIMQVRITRSRMAGDPPEILITPRLQDFALLDFDRAGEAIEEGHRAAEHAFTAMPGSRRIDAG